ncbi:HD domain-containing phosphohydrolase [Candidatus Bipolaricaulota sp. J31]
MRAFLSSFPHGVLLLDRRGKILWASPRMEELFGVAGEGLVGKPVTELVPPHLRPLHSEFCERLKSARHMGRPGHVFLHALEGEVPVEVDLIPWASPAGEVTVALIRRLSLRPPDRAREFLRQQRLQSETLALAEKLVSAEHAGEIVEALGEALCQAFGTGAVFLWRLEGGRALVLRWAGEGEPERGYAVPLDDAEDILIRVCEDGTAEVLNPVPSDAAGRTLGRALRLRSALVVALQAEGRVEGVAVIGDRGDPARFSEADLVGARLLAHLAASALHRTALQEQTQRRLERLQTLREIDLAIASNLDPHFTIKVLLEETENRLGVEAVAVLLLEPESMSLRVAGARGFEAPVEGIRIPLSRALASRVTRERRPIYVELSPPVQMPSPLSEIALREGFTSLHVAPMISKQRLLGVLEVFHREPPHPPEEWTDFLEALAAQAAIAVENASLLSDLQRTNLELRIAYEATLRSWGQLLELRDRETKGHTERVVELTMKLARELGVRGEELMYMRWGALLHDIGKLGVPDSIMFKPGKLTEEEWEVMRRHPIYAYEVLSGIEFLRPALEIPYCHHERWDGTGYPRGLRGEEIPLSARIFAVVDAWDAMRSERPYRGPLSREEALREIREGAGSQFDPRVVRAFLDLVERGEV